LDSTDEITVPLPVTWASSPEYDGEMADTYIFTPKLPEGIILANGVEVPVITVVVGETAPTGTVIFYHQRMLPASAAFTKQQSQPCSRLAS
jgi:hypothetical protein